MPSSLVELRPNRRLLDHEFEGYKLNLRSFPHYIHNLDSPVDRVFPNEIQYSFVHAKLFAFHNHLVLDHWDYALSYYYIDNKQHVRQVVFENSNHSFQNRIIYDIPAHVERKSGHFNLSLSFPSGNLAVISDGTGYLHVIETVNRNRPEGRNQIWQTLHSSLVLGEERYFVIVDSRMQEINNNEILHCLLQSVEQSQEHFHSVLSWVTFEHEGQMWKQTSLRQLQGKGIVHYTALESNCSALYIASDNPFKFISDSENEVLQKPPEKPKTIIYTWLQTSEDITITLKLQPGFVKNSFKVKVTLANIQVSYAGNTLIDGKLRHKIDSELTTWNMQDSGQVDILITKTDSIIWDELIENGDGNGEQIMDATLVDEAHNRLQHLCSETEAIVDQSITGLTTHELDECDAASEEDTVLVRFDATSHEITHRIPLSVHQYLFDLRIESQEVPALVLRHDVDACVWQPYAQLINSETWPIKHIGTLMAFGYVQSSKENRKFVTCPPNFSYSVVCEASRHIFVYQNCSNEDSQLRKRTGGVMKQIKVGQQHVFNVDKYGEVLGINATNNHLFILTENKLIAIEIE